VPGGPDPRTATTAQAAAELYTPLTSMVLDPPSAFGSAPVGGAPVRRTVTITAAGPAPLRVSGVTVEGPAAGDFSVVDDSCTLRTMKAGAACALTVRFAPAVEGVRRATLAVTANIGRETRRIGLDGDGATAAGAVRPPRAQVAPPVPPAAAAPSRQIAPRAARGRTAGAPFMLTVASRLEPPRGVPRALACRGAVRVTVRRGARVIGAKTVRLDHACRFRARFQLTRARLRGARTVTVVARFAGNAHVAPSRPTVRRVTVPPVPGAG
jgi:hypothetical protein